MCGTWRPLRMLGVTCRRSPLFALAGVLRMVPGVDHPALRAAAALALGAPLDELAPLGGATNGVYRHGRLVARVCQLPASPALADLLTTTLSRAAVLARHRLAIAPARPTPVASAGHLVTLWPHLESVRASTWDDVATALARLHAVSAGQLPGLTAWRPGRWLETALRLLPAATAARVRAYAEPITAAVTAGLAHQPPVLLHHDAKPSNVMVTAAGPILIDVDELATGPAAVDLSLVTTTLRPGELAAAARAYTAAGGTWPSPAALAAGVHARTLDVAAGLIWKGRTTDAITTLAAAGPAARAAA